MVQVCFWPFLFGFSGCTLLFLAVRAYVRCRHESDPELVSEAIASGAMAYLLKENAFEELVRAVHTVMEGDFYISPDLSAGISPAQSPEKSPLLTPRESEVLKWIALGLTNKKIANTLHISVKTVDTHRTRILRKLGVHNTAGMVRYAVKTAWPDFIGLDACPLTFHHSQYTLVLHLMICPAQLSYS